MSKSLKKTLKIVIPIALGFFLVWYSYSTTSAEDQKLILDNITTANPFWIVLSIIIGIASHVSRAIRWNYLLEPMGYSPKISNNFFMVMIAYLANLGIPRSGEFLRATALASYENVPFEKGFGTIVTERVIDLLMLLLIIAIALFLQTDVILGYLNEYGVNLAFSIALLLVGIIGLITLIYLIRKAKSGFLLKLKTFLNGLLDGVTSILKMKKKWPFIIHTLIIWSCYVGMFWAIKYTLFETQSLGLSQLLVCFIAGAFAMTATNGGLGLYPIAVSSALAIYGISSNAGDSFGWIMWIAQTLMVVVLGAISFVLLPLFNRNR